MRFSRGQVAASAAGGFLAALVCLPSPPANAAEEGACQFNASAAALRLEAINSSGITGSWTTNRANGALLATDAWDSTKAPDLVWNGSGESGTIYVDIASSIWPNHGVTEWNCDAFHGTGTSKLYYFNVVNIRLGTAHNKPSSTWHHVAAHEYGHALALNHTNASGNATSHIMKSGSYWPDSSCTNCRKTPSIDDLQGACQELCVTGVI